MGAGQEVPQAETPQEISSEARTEILKSARGIIAQDGVESFTLSAVARDADVPRTSVYELFHNKNELLIALAADDLGNIARQMNGEKPVSQPSPLPHAELVASLIDKVDHPDRPRLPADTIVPAAPQLVEELPPTLEDPAPLEAGPLPSVAKKRGEASQLSDIINRLTLPTTAMGESSAQAVGRMDRRMAMLERALAELDDRFDKFSKGANDSFHTTEAGLEGLVQRVERTDLRISETATSLRGEMLAAFTSLEPPPAEPPRVTPPPAEGEYETPAAVLQATAPEGDLRSQLKRQSANDDQHAQSRQFAGEPQAAKPAPKKHRRKRKHFFSRTELFGIGAISTAVILATMGIALSEGFIDVKHGHLGAPPLRETQPQQVAQAAIPAIHANIAKPVTPAPVKIATAEPPATPTPAKNLSPLQRIEALANGGNTKAAVILGVKYLDGDGVARNDGDAAQWLERAAKAGEPVAQYRLGTLYQRGVGVVQDETQALHWYEAAANQGNRKAMHNLGVFYAEGRGATQDYDKAASWFQRAANMGYVDSQFDLAVLYERGAGVPQSLSDAYKWYVIAAQNGDEVSKARVDVLETQLDASELFAAKAVAHSFHPQPLSRVANMTPRASDLSAR